MTKQIRCAFGDAQVRHDVLMPAPPVGTRLPEFEPVAVEVTVQVILYRPDCPPTLCETLGLEYPDGTLTVRLPNVPPPPQGTPIQFIVYNNGDTPTIVEGTTDVVVDGQITINPALVSQPL